MWARFVLKWIEYGVSRGEDPERLAANIGVDLDQLRDTEARVPLGAMYGVVEALLTDEGPVALGMDYARRAVPEEFDALGYLMMTSATLGQGIERLHHYQRVWIEGERSLIRVEGGRALLRYVPYGPHRAAHDVFATMFVGDMASGGAKATGRSISVLDASLRQPPPPSTVHDAFVAMLGAEPSWRAPVDQIVVPAEVMDYPLLRSESTLHEFFERHVARLAEAIPEVGSATEQVRNLIERDLHRGVPTVDDLAAALRMSKRTLQRRLAEEETSVAALAEQVRRGRASDLLGAGVRIAEVSYLLGYAEPSAFHRAFRRWTGYTPEQWRERRAQDE